MKWFEMLKQKFESSSTKTPQYLSWHKTFKREFKAFLGGLHITRVEIGKPNHFDASGFFQRPDGQVFYFSIGDLRFSKNEMMVRTAKDFNDYSGGRPQWLYLNNWEDFECQFKSIISK